jgi:hypothetical protein
MLHHAFRSCLTLLLVAWGFAPSASAQRTTAQKVDPFLQSQSYQEAEIKNVEPVYIAELPPEAYGEGESLTMEGPLDQAYIPEGSYDLPAEAMYGGRSYNNGWCWELLPDGLIYRSYLAGPRESRLGLHTFDNKTPTMQSETLWEATLGGRRGIFRYGSDNMLRPEGWQLDIEGAAMVRLNLDENRDVDASDFRFGIPLTYGEGKWQYKMGYYHLSSHLGDELIMRTGVNSRINYVRDAIIVGASYNPFPAWRLYGETAYAFYTAGGAEPWEFQFGAEYALPGPTGAGGTPFIATNAHLREEINFSGDWTFQTGWLWRGMSGSMFRLGLHYMNGKSTNYQFFDRNEEQIGVGVWYDF